MRGDDSAWGRQRCRRRALKLAAGAGKTTVMAMLIAWQTVDAVRRPGSRQFSCGFLIVAPGLTIKDRLRVLLPRSDFHKLFGISLITVTPDFRVEVSSRVKEEWFNGKAYYRLHGHELASVPKNLADRPSAARLQWHNENRLRA